MLIAVMMMAVPYLSFHIVSGRSAMTVIRLMIICIKSWISNTQKNRIKNRSGTLFGN